MALQENLTTSSASLPCALLYGSRFASSIQLDNSLLLCYTLDMEAEFYFRMRS